MDLSPDEVFRHHEIDGSITYVPIKVNLEMEEGGGRIGAEAEMCGIWWNFHHTEVRMFGKLIFGDSVIWVWRVSDIASDKMYDTSI